MKTTYSRRELYAFGEPIGESSTHEIAGRRIYGGGGGIVGDIVGGVSDAISGAADAVGDVAQGAGDAVGDAYMAVRDPLEAAAVVGGNYLLPGSGLLTSHLVSDNAKNTLGSDMGRMAMFGSGIGGSLGGNFTNWGGGAGNINSGITGLGDASAWDAATADMAPGGLDPYDIYGSGASQWGGGGDYMDLGAVSGTDLGGAGGSPASWGSGSWLGNAANIAKQALGSGGSGSGGLSLGGAALGAAGLAGLMNMLKADSARYGVPGRQDNVGSMGQFKYNPASFSATRPDPAMFRPQGAPTAKIGYAAGGGISTLGGYSDGGRLLKGPGDGMSDNIPAKIGHKQPARLADGEFVVPADVVSHLGNGSTDAGAKQLYKMMDKVRSARTGRKAQGKEIKADKFLPK